MKLSPKQIAASAAGAILAAVAASLFGEKGTIIGVALGSAVATTATALVAQSIEKTHHAVKQVVVKVPGRPSILRSLGTTEAAGEVTETAGAVSEAAGEVEIGTDESPVLEADVAGDAAAQGVAGDAAVEETAERRLVARSRGSGRRPAWRPSSSGDGQGHPQERAPAISGVHLNWWVLAVSMLAVFVVAVGVITAFELLAGRPLSSVLGSSPATGGTSAGSLFAPSPTTLPPLPTTTSTTSSTTTSTTSTTSTTTGAGTATSVPGSTTTTTGPGTTTSVSGSTTTSTSTSTTTTTTTTSTTTTTTTTTPSTTSTPGG